MPEDAYRKQSWQIQRLAWSGIREQGLAVAAELALDPTAPAHLFMG
jgi:hypothetical protein